MFRLPRALMISFIDHFLLVLGIMGYFFSGGGRFKEEIPFELQMSDVHVHHLDSRTRRGFRNSEQGVPRQLPESDPSLSPLSPATPNEGESLPADLSDMERGARNAYFSMLMGLISAKKSYPRSSILNEEEGVTLIRVLLGPGGKVLKVEQVSSSGFARLDEAALETLRAFDTLPLPPGWSGGVRLLIPIRFEINPQH